MTTPLTTPRPLWILGPWRDLAFFILTPLFVIPIVFALKQRVPLETLGLYILGLGGFGHHLPGFIRAYADRDLFRQYRLRFTVVPLLLLAIAGFYSFVNLNALACATVFWGVWHGAMQVNGFLRIYDSKAGSFRPATARLDWLLCIAWFGLAILHSPTKMFSLVAQFYVSGGVLIPPLAFEILRRIWDTGTALITLLFAVNAWRQWKAGMPPSPIKLLTAVSSFAFWWFCTVTTGNLILGVVLWEIFHDVQYNVLVWLFQRRRVDGDMHAGFAEKFLFSPGGARMSLYALFIIAYGSIGVFTSFSDLNMPEKILLGAAGSQWLLRITLASALLHFYYDGFIWRIREQRTRAGLNLQEGTTIPAVASTEKFWLHGWKWAFFLLPVGLMGFSQYRGRNPDFKSQVLNLSASIPGSWLAHFLAGSYHKEDGFSEQAETDYRMAVRYNPDFDLGHLFLADLLYAKGEFSEAVEHYRRALELDPSDAMARERLASLYLRTEQFWLAGEQFQIALKAEPDNPDLNFGMATALLRQGKLQEAGAHAEKTLRAVPNHSGALNYLGMIRDVGGDPAGAIAYYRKALAADSTNASARENLTTALAKINLR